VVNAPDLALKAGNIKAANTVMLGAMSVYMPDIKLAIWELVLGESLPDKVLKANLKAFELGREHAAKSL
jgi:indolepyruvate ferredoxin oxidoreductase, beta subunit